MANDGGNGEYSPEKKSNPFADDLPDAPYSDNPFAPPQSGGCDPNLEGHFDSVVPHKGGLLLLLGITGMMLSAMGLVAFLFCVPLNLFSLVFAVPAWVMAKHDLRGMNVGAVDPAGRGRTRAGYLLGMLATGLAMLPIVIAIAMFAANVGTEAMFEFRNWLGF